MRVACLNIPSHILAPRFLASSVSHFFNMPLHITAMSLTVSYRECDFISRIAILSLAIDSGKYIFISIDKSQLIFLLERTCSWISVYTDTFSLSSVMEIDICREKDTPVAELGVEEVPMIYAPLSYIYKITIQSCILSILFAYKLAFLFPVLFPTWQVLVRRSWLLFSLLLGFKIYRQQRECALWVLIFLLSLEFTFHYLAITSCTIVYK